MSLVDRFSVSLDTELLAAFDDYIASMGYTNRSEAVRDLIRDVLSRTRWHTDRRPVLASLTYLTEPRSGEARARVAAMLTEAGEQVRAVMSAPLPGGGELQTVHLRGPAAEVQQLANRIETLRGITHARLHVLPLETAGE